MGSFEDAIQLSELTDRKKIVAAAQASKK